MDNRINVTASLSRPAFLRLCISLSVVFGTVVGILLAGTAGEQYSSLIYAAASSRPSVIGVLICVFFPYFLIASMVSHLKPWVIFLLVGFRFALISSCWWGIQKSFQHGAWLVQLLLLFPDICLMPLLLWFTVRFLDGRRVYGSAVRFIIILVVYIYYSLISPYLATLIETYESMGRYVFHVGFDWRL